MVNKELLLVARPRIDVLAHGLRDEETAFRIEAAVIDLLELDALTNEVRGWRSLQLGRIPLTELTMYYAAKPVEVEVPALLIRINRLYRHNMTPQELYEATRGVWKLGTRCAKARAPSTAAASESGSVAAALHNGRRDAARPAGGTPAFQRRVRGATTAVGAILLTMDRSAIVALLRTHLPELKARYGVAHLALFGSGARDELRIDSDIDVLVEFEDRATYDGYFSLRERLEQILSRKVDLVTEKGLKPRARRHVEKDLIRVA